MGHLGALTFRAAFIFAGASAVRRWSWLEYGFAAILIVSGWRAIRDKPAGESNARQKNRVLEWLSHHMPVTKTATSRRLIVQENGRWKGTVLLLAIVAVELTDILFAVDSIPAALSVTRQEFLIYSANAFAILGLRSFHIVIAATLGRLRYLHYGLGATLIFSGLKMAFGRVLEISLLLSAGVIVRGSRNLV